MNELDLIRMILEGKVPPKKDEKKDDKEKDKKPSDDKEKKDASDSEKEEMDPKSKENQAKDDEEKKDGSPIKDDGKDDGAEEKEVSDEGDKEKPFGEKDKEGLGKDKEDGDEDDNEKDNKDTVHGNTKSKVVINPPLDMEPEKEESVKEEIVKELIDHLNKNGLEEGSLRAKLSQLGQVKPLKPKLSGLDQLSRDATDTAANRVDDAADKLKSSAQQDEGFILEGLGAHLAKHDKAVSLLRKLRDRHANKAGDEYVNKIHSHERGDDFERKRHDHASKRYSFHMKKNKKYSDHLEKLGHDD